MSAVDPRKYEMWDDYRLMARRILDDADLNLDWRKADLIAEQMADTLFGHFVTLAEADSHVVFGMDGTGPFCSWCGRWPGPRLTEGHAQKGVFCECRRENAEETPVPEENAAVTS